MRTSPAEGIVTTPYFCPELRSWKAVLACSCHLRKSCQSTLIVVGYFMALFQSHRKNVFMIEENTILPSIDFWRVEQFQSCYIWQKCQKLRRVFKLFSESLEVFLISCKIGSLVLGTRLPNWELCSSISSFPPPLRSLICILFLLDLASFQIGNKYIKPKCWKQLWFSRMSLG